MITSIHSYGGVTATVYVMQRGEKIPRHKHPTVHTTGVAAGKSEVELLDVATFAMVVGEVPQLLPPGIDHEIRALEDGTVVVNLSIGGRYAGPVGDIAPAQSGGVALHDGTVVDAA
jgi:quercetin dioxygenase-like cupin family protein